MEKAKGKGMRNWFVMLLAWFVAFCAVCWAAVVWSPAFVARRAASGELGEWFWALDVCASFASQSVLVLFALGVVVAVLRRWIVLGVIVFASICVLALPWSVPRLSRADSDEPALRVLVFNAKTGSGEVAAKESLIAGVDPDVVAVIEPPIDFVQRYLMGGGVLDGYRSGWRPDGAWSGCPLLLSKHPVDAHGSELAVLRRELWDHFYRLEIVRSPAGDVAIVQMHARSPRNAARWRVGLEQLLEVADLAKRIGEVTGLPVVVAGDFNSPPTGVRARAFAARSGLVRAKPAGRLGGTYPSQVPVFVSVAIDDMYATPGVRVRKWEPIGSAGSDHRALVVELALDQCVSESEP